MRSEFSYDPKTRKLILSDREQIMTDELQRAIRQDDQLHRLDVLGWADSLAIINDARGLVLHHAIAINEVLDLMIIEAHGGNTFQDWTSEPGRIVQEFCNR